MNLDHFKEKLLKTKRECETGIERLQRGTTGTAEAGVRDESDDAVTDELTSEALQEAGVQSRTLELVNAALARMGDGSYGKCLACGRPIEPARLEAIPWAEYCLKDQKMQEEKTLGPATGATL